jgi:DNA-binding CsgD family transcriptional regulator
VAKRVSSPTLIGRRSELAELQEAAQRAAAGRPGLVLVAGEAGVGKSRLVAELAAWARTERFRVLTGGCVSLSGEVAPFAPIVEALRMLPTELSPSELTVVVGPRAEELDALLPHTAGAAQAPGATGISVDGSQARRLELVLGLLGRLAQNSPLILIIEDIHWADGSTLDLLTFLVRNLRTEPILLIATLRTDEPESARSPLPVLAELERLPSVQRIDLDRLNRADVAQQMAAILGGRAASGFVEDVFARSQGNPFFAEELVAATPIAGAVLPPTLRDVVVARVGALNDEARGLVRTASVAGRRFPEQLLESIAGLDDAAFEAALREAIDRYVLVREPGEAGDRISFRHALAQEALYADLLRSERLRLHAACARAIDQGGRSHTDPIRAAELAYHWQAAEEPERALRAAIGAGEAAQAAGVRKEAAVQFERALALIDGGSEMPEDLALDRVELLERAAANGEHDPARSVRHIREALGLVDADRDPVRAGLLHAALGRYLRLAGEGPAALAACRTAVQLVPSDPPSLARASVLAGLGHILTTLMLPADMLPIGREDGIAICEEAVAIAAALHAPRLETHALTSLGGLVAYRRDPEAGLTMLRRSLEIASEIDSLDDIGRAYDSLLDVLTFAATRYDEAAELALSVIDAIDLTRLSGVIVTLVHVNAVVALYLGGRWDESGTALERAGLLPRSGVGEIALGLRAAQLDVGRGQLEAARGRLDELAERVKASGDNQWSAPIVEIRAELEILDGRPGAALDAIDDGLPDLGLRAPATVTRVGRAFGLGVRAAADLLGAMGRRAGTAEAERVRARGSSYLAQMRAHHDAIAKASIAHVRLALPYLALCEAEWSRLDGASDPAAWARTAEAFEAWSQAYDAAYARYREGEALLTRRRDAAARSSLRAAHATAVRLGATPLRAAIEALAARGRVDLVDARAAAEASTAAALGLTEREADVVALVAEGLSNKEIGSRLFITEKTASHHVSSVLGKLGVASRAEAAAEAVRQGITSKPA